MYYIVDLLVDTIIVLQGFVHLYFVLLFDDDVNFYSQGCIGNITET